jgi:hypothetical protein
MCYICRQNKANTLEHIVPKSLGGKKKVRILCHKCNNVSGGEVDNYLKDFFTSNSSHLSNQVLKGIFKIATNFCTFNNLISKVDLLPFIFENINLSEIVKPLNYEAKNDEVCHSIVINGAKDGDLYCFISIYNLSFSVLLNSFYEVSDIQKILIKKRNV